MYFQKITIISLLILLTTGSNGQTFYNIPKQNIKPYDILGDSVNPYKLKDKNCVLETDSFLISGLITFREFREYLWEIKRDSSYSFYLSQWPDSSIASEENYKKYLSSERYNEYPVVGISWKNAMNFCKWKTLKDNKADTISFIYRLPGYVEWVAAWSHLNGNKIRHDFNCNFSDWTMNIYCEGGCLGSYGDSCNGYKGRNYYPTKSDRMNRMYAMGQSFNFNFSASYLRGYYIHRGYRQIAFRIVKVFLPVKEDNKYLVNKIIEDWQTGKVIKDTR